MDTRLRRRTLWLIVFVTGAVFQFWRESPIDALIYSFVAALILLAELPRFESTEFRALRLRSLTVILLFSTLVFLIFPIHSTLTAVGYLVLIPMLMGVVLQKDRPTTIGSTSAVRRSSKIWFTIGSLTCICELGNYFASDITHNDKAFPTLTVLVDPFVASNGGKIVFVLLWAWIGFGLLRMAAER
jgi:predicted membrane protein